MCLKCLVQVWDMAKLGERQEPQEEGAHHEPFSVLFDSVISDFEHRDNLLWFTVQAI